MKAKRPIEELLESPTDERAIARMWTNIRDRRDDARVRSSAPIAWAAVATAMALAVASGALWVWHDDAPDEHVALRPDERAAPDDARLRTDDGQPPTAMATDHSSREIGLDDGSAIELDAHSSLETIVNDATHFSTLLTRGRARFSVRPGGTRRWTVESGLATVEVVGTVFSVERGVDGVRVEVERGVVVVRGERVADRVARLTAGESIFIPTDPPPEPVAIETHSPAPIARRTETPEPEPPGEAIDVPETAPPIEIEGTAHRPRAIDPHEQPGGNEGPEAALAAFTLGRMEMDDLDRPARAREALRRAIRLGLPARLEEQARRRLEQLEHR